MKTLQIFLLLFFCHLATSEVTTTISEKDVAPSLTTILSKDSELIADTKSQPTKRDSTDQTANYDGKKQKEEPFKPIFGPPQQEQSFRPTTVRYALAGAAPQAYYEKPETGGIQYAVPTKPTIDDDGGGILYAPHSTVAHRTAATVDDNIIRGVPYYREAYYHPSYQQNHHQQHQPRNYVFASPQQVKASAAAAEVPATPAPQQHYYAHSDPEEQHYMQQLLLQQQQQQRPHPQPQPQHHQQQQQIRYIIAIPIEYARQLQQQLAHIPTHASQAFALHQHQPNVAYRPQIHYTSTPTVAAAPPTEAASVAPQHTMPTAYTMQVIKLPAGLLQSLEASIYQQKPAVTVAPQQYQQAAPLYQHHPQQQQQQATIYYAYPYHQQQQPQQQQQHQQQHQQGTQQQATVRIGSTKPSATVATPSISPTPTPITPLQATPSATPHFIQSKPIFLQQQLQLQHQHHHHQQQQEPMSFTHYTQSHAPAASPYFIRQVFVPQAAAHHAPGFVNLQPPPPGGKFSSYVYPYAAQLQQQQQHHHHIHHQHEAAVSLPYFRHPGAVHYGTHLYHPPTPLTPPPNKVLGPVVASTAATRQHQQQPHQQQQYQHQTAAGASATAESGPTPQSVVKYP